MARIKITEKTKTRYFLIFFITISIGNNPNNTSDISIYKGWEKINKALEDLEVIQKEKLVEITNSINDKYLTIIDHKYPKVFKKSLKPPFLFFYKGNIKLLNKNNKANFLPIVFTDEKIDKSVVDFFEKTFGKSKIILGASFEFEKNILKLIKHKQIILVKDSGINSNINFPMEIEEKILKNNGLIISEFPDQTISSVSNWNESNRIKICLSSNIILVNSEKNKYLFEMLFYIISQKKKVAFLENVNDQENFNNFLIKNGAQGINNIKEIEKLWQKI